MPTIATHAIAGAAIAQALAPCSRRNEITWIAAACAMLPDIDVLGLGMGIPYGDLWGHRGFTHSVLFAGVVALVVTSILRSRRDLMRVFICIFAATVSHGLLDAFTNGGLGVAFLAPFDLTRYFFSFRPIEVSPIGAAAFLTPRGLSVMLSEITWVWPPSIGLLLAARFVRCREAPGVRK
jgi:inner membrane protein